MNNAKPINIGSRGYYSLSVLDKNGNPVEGKQVENVDNVITYEGAFFCLVGTNTFTRIFTNLWAAVGTGSTERTRSSTALATEEAGRSDLSNSTRAGSEVDNLDGTSTVTTTRVLEFGLGEKVGTYSEVGLYSASSGGVFVAGQLIKDEMGNPTTITVLADEQLVVTYTLEWIIPIVSNLIGTGTVMDADSNPYDYEVWAQPYFKEYLIGDDSAGCRYFASSSKVSIRQGDGTTTIDPNSSEPGGWSLPSHNGTGTVTTTTSGSVYSPTSFSGAGIVFLSFYTFSGTSASTDIVDTATALSISGSSSEAGVVVKFIDPITKTTNDTFSIEVELQLTV